ncbi:hypothetical protein [Candidatus Cryosericum terrychapinii]|jgi:hypothetical protein|uniref:Uncharacterized protein n=1 Tax=Candidatus Cryosericum terrychapinii TaxID=2290919 RepID=A0A398CW30_9BACT|nr:hypothetical protein [Candidatus Cryosericum terrychapinii]RIE06932.1 hypothetical protein SMC7_00135 [Candidatus Cryosericum terrychapinii]
MSGGYWNRALVVDLEEGTSCDEVLDASVSNEYHDLRDLGDRLGIPTIETARRLRIDQLSTGGSAPEG